MYRIESTEKALREWEAGGMLAGTDPKKDHTKRSWVTVAPWGQILQATEAGKKQPPFLCPKELEKQVEGCWGPLGMALPLHRATKAQLILRDHFL